MAYFPNSTARAVLDNLCAECPISDDAPCPILFVQMVYNYDQVDIPKLREAMTVLVDEAGTCKMRPLIADAVGL